MILWYIEYVQQAYIMEELQKITNITVSKVNLRAATLRDMGQAKSKVKTLNFKKTNLHLFKKLVSTTP